MQNHSIPSKLLVMDPQQPNNKTDNPFDKFYGDAEEPTPSGPAAQSVAPSYIQTPPATPNPDDIQQELNQMAEAAPIQSAAPQEPAPLVPETPVQQPNSLITEPAQPSQMDNPMSSMKESPLADSTPTEEPVATIEKNLLLH